MSSLAASSTVEGLWQRCLEIDHERADRDCIVTLYESTNQALLEEIRSSDPGHRRQGLVQRHDILCVWAEELGLTLS